MSPNTTSQLLTAKILENSCNDSTLITIHSDNPHFIANILKNKSILEKLLQLKGKAQLSTTEIPINIKNILYNTAKFSKQLKFADRQYKFNKDDFCKLINKRIKTNWNNSWKNEQNKSKLKNIKNNVLDVNPAINLNRRDQIIITRLRIGHTKLTHEYLLNKEDPRICTECEIPLNVEHIKLKCPTFKLERKKCKIKNNLREVLNEKTQILNVIKFLEQIELRHKL